MKCPICNTENPPEASSCQQCGFGMVRVEPAWPEQPVVPEWPATPLGAASPTSDGPAVPTAASPAPPAPPPSSPSDDELARMHVERGFQALRQNLFEQAQWEFEQARDLADNLDIAQMAEAQMTALIKDARQAAAQAIDGSLQDLAAQAQAAVEQAVPRPAPPRSTPTPAPATSPLTAPLDWAAALRDSVGLAILAALLVGLGAVICIGFFVAPLLGFVAGRIVGRRSDTERKPSSIAQAVLAGGAIGLGSWLGEVIAHPLWIDFLPQLSSDPLAVMAVVSCFPGALYLLLAVAASAVGWQVGRRSRKPAETERVK